MWSASDAVEKLARAKSALCGADRAGMSGVLCDALGVHNDFRICGTFKAPVMRECMGGATRVAARVKQKGLQCGSKNLSINKWSVRRGRGKALFLRKEWTLTVLDWSIP